jgi:hypothetical protein
MEALMERRHEEILLSRLEDAWKNGVAHITFPELYLWYNVEKLAARTYRDLSNRWSELTGNDAGGLAAVDGRNGMFIFGHKKQHTIE